MEAGSPIGHRAGSPGSILSDDRPETQSQEECQKRRQQDHGPFRSPRQPAHCNRRPVKENRTDRKNRYDRIESLTRQLALEIQMELTRQKELWDVDGGHEGEEYWDSRKKEIYKELEKLAGGIQQAFRDRQKEEVLELWSKEQEMQEFVLGIKRSCTNGGKDEITRDEELCSTVEDGK